MGVRDCLALLALSIIACFSTTAAHALIDYQDMEFDLVLANGYRQDRLSTKIEAFDPPGTLILTDELKAKNIDLYQVGLKGRWMWCNFLVRVEGDYGWVQNGTYHEEGSTPSGLSSRSRAKIHSGNTRDLIAGVGYLFCVSQCFSIGPVAGWSYDYQRIKMKSARTDGIPDPILNGLKYTNKWQGPWAGIDAIYRWCAYALHIGYEYHWADWRATWRLDGPDVLGVAFSDRRKSNNAFGQVVYIDGSWNFCDYWTAGIGLKFQEWKARHGRERPLAGSFAAVGFSDTETDKVRHAKWCSYTVSFDLGYNF